MVRCYHKVGLFAGLGQKDHEFVAAIAEGVINEAERRLDEGSDFGQQLGADQESMRVIDALKVVEINKDHAKLVAEACGALDFWFHHLIERTGGVEPEVVIRH